MQYAELPKIVTAPQIHRGIRAESVKLIIAGLAVVTTHLGAARDTGGLKQTLGVARGATCLVVGDGIPNVDTRASNLSVETPSASSSRTVTYFPLPFGSTPLRRRLDDSVRRTRERGFGDARVRWVCVTEELVPADTRTVRPCKGRAPGVRVAKRRSVSTWREPE
ncbi:hypothetical protein DL767_010208 [Monosporascus sp. MG133]|nr:hypothetical protein DL767_010208 [Monosporascus sp. MG133]